MAGSDRRGSERVMLEIPIRVFSFGGNAGAFSEETRTIQVNRAGARIPLARPVNPGDEIRIVNLENMREADFRVVGAIRLSRGSISDWGVECVDEDRDIWGIDFPPPLDPAGSQAAALLRCQGCGKEALRTLTMVEVDVLESSGSIQRRCDACSEFSQWSHASLIRQPQAQETVECGAASPRSAMKSEENIEKRAHRRVAVKLPVQVMDSRGYSEASKTENMSKGGFAVVLKILLAVGQIVTVACPYTKDGQNLFQKAEVRRRVIFTPGERWVYGLRYVTP